MSPPFNNRPALFAFLFKKRLFITGYLCVVLLSAQDIHFSQYSSFPFHLSPSFTGLFSGDVRTGAGYRQQWRTVPVNYQTLSGWADIKWPGLLNAEKKLVSLGLDFFNDRAGDLRYGSTRIQVPASFQFSPDSSFLCLVGMSLGFTQTGFDASRMTTDSQFDGYQYNPQLLPQEQFVYSRFNTFHWSLGAGIVYTILPNHKAQLHAAIHQPHNPKLSFQEGRLNYVDPRLTITGGYSFTPSHSKISIQPGLLVQNQGKYREWIPQIMMQYYLRPLNNESVLAGLSTRWKDAVMVHACYTRQSWYTGISYDVNLSAFRQATSLRGAWEIFLIKTFSASYTPLIRKKPCPVFL